MSTLLHIYGQRRFHRISDGMNRSSGCWVTAFARTGVPNRHAWTWLKDKWPCHCTSMRQNGSMKPEMVWSGPSVQLQCPQELECLTGMPECARWAVAHLLTKMVPQNLKWSKSAQWLWSYSMCKVWMDRRTDGRKDGCMDGRRLFPSPHAFIWKGWGQNKLI